MKRIAMAAVILAVMVFSSVPAVFAQVPGDDISALEAQRSSGGSSGGLVPCGTKTTPPCQPCHIFLLGQNVLNFLWWGVSVPLAALMFAYGGFLMIVPSSGSISKGKKIITTTIIGLAITFFGWLIVDTIIKAVGGQSIGSGETGIINNIGPWNSIKCDIQPPSTPGPVSVPTGFLTPNYVDVSTPLQTTVKNQFCPTCVNLGVPTKASNACGLSQCLVDATLNDRLRQLHTSFLSENKGDYWQVTEAWPPTVVHQNPCHTRGTCVDANLTSSYAGNPQDIKNFITKSSQNQLRAVYEVTTEARRDQLVAAGVPQSNILVESRITGEHFSVYLP